MQRIIYLSDYICESDSDFESEDATPQIEDLLEDPEALAYLGEDAFELLIEGLSHRKLLVRTRAVTQLVRLFPQREEVFELFRTALLDRREKREFRFHVARNMVLSDLTQLQSLLDELAVSRGCNDRICAAFLMGRDTNPDYMFLLLNFLQDSNDCVKVAAFFSLMKFGKESLLHPLQNFVERATVFQLKLLEKNIHDYRDCKHHSLLSDLVQEGLDSFKSNKVAFHPLVYEQSYSQETLSKLDRLGVRIEIEPQDSFSLFEN